MIACKVVVELHSLPRICDLQTTTNCTMLRSVHTDAPILSVELDAPSHQAGCFPTSPNCLHLPAISAFLRQLLAAFRNQDQHQPLEECQCNSEGRRSAFLPTPPRLQQIWVLCDRQDCPIRASILQRHAPFSI